MLIEEEQRQELKALLNIVSAARKQGEKCLVLSLLLTFFPRGQGTTLFTVGIGPPTPVDPIQELLTDTSMGLFSR